MTIEEAHKKLVELKADAAIDLEAIDFRVRPGMATRRKAAINELPHASAQYRSILRENTYAILVVGPEDKAAKFLDVVEEEDSSVVIDNANEVYESLADEVEPSIGSRREWTINQDMLLDAALAELLTDMGAWEPLEINIGTYIVPTREDTVREIRRAITKVSNLTAAIIEFNALGEAEAIGYEFPLLPVVVFGVSEEEIEAGKIQQVLFNGRVSVIDLNKEAPTKKTLFAAYDALKKSYDKANGIVESQENTKKEE